MQEILTTINLVKQRELKAGALAHGQKQWLEIGMLLSQNAKLLLVDEPAAGMTDEETHKTGELLLSLAGKHTIVVIEHDMVFVRQIAAGRKVTVLHQGSILCEGPVDEVQGFLLDVGWGTYGFKAAPAAGSRLAELIATGRTPDVIQPFALSRFANLQPLGEKAAAAVSA